jgi:two-component system NtrC family sensor kinase
MTPSATFASLSIRNKLLVMVLLPLLGVLPLLGAVLLWWGSEAVDRLLLTKVRSDLAVAHGYFERVLGEVGSSVGAVAESQLLYSALTQSDQGLPGKPPEGSAALLHRLAQREKLDFMRLLPAAETLLDGTSVELLQPAQLAALAPELQARVAVPLLDTRNATPSARRVEDRAMVLLSTRAVRTPQGRLLGHVQGGLLLNRNLPFIDHINEIVYPEGSLPFAEWGSRGTATLFLEDVRISTNVRLFGGEKDEREDRAIGTRVSASVREAVLGRGTTWLDRAFVVNEWYVSGYQPLADGAGRRVGMLYVGVLERPFTLLKYAALAAIGLLFFGVMIVAATLSLRWARTIFRPLEQMEATMQRVEAGAPDARVGVVASTDEIGRLASHLDRLLAAINDNTQRLQSWNAELDAKVAERTAALQAAQQQLVQSEKLATVGQLTASIAHEVNNPIAVIQGNLDLVRETLGVHAASVAPELDLVDAQIERMRLISTQLLQFARPAEFAGYVSAVDTGPLLQDCLLLTRHPLERAGIHVERDFAATRQPAINRTELQQVLVNLIVNATHAMPSGGTLTLRTRDAGAADVEIEVADSGSGIAPELLQRLFQPFVSQRKEGTGLGLWISRSLVQRYSGEISAANRDGGGASFTVRLKTEA